ncbi:MAG: hypothetical protein QXN21_04070 [Candidatus Bathyarchaeia archaeon]
MNLEDLKTYKEVAAKAKTILGRRIEPIGTEMDLLNDVIAEVRTLRISNRDVEIPGIKRATEEGIIHGAVSYFRDKVKKDIMPVQYAKDDNLIIEPLYRPKIFNMSDFTINWSGLTPPAAIDLFDPGGTAGAYNLQVDKELIILTDIICLDANPAVYELLATVDGETQRPVVPRKDWLATDLHIFEFPFPLVADINIRLQGRVESASGSITYLPIGIHVCLGSVHAKTLA